MLDTRGLAHIVADDLDDMYQGCTDDEGQSRVHTESDLRGYITWCDSHGLDPLATSRPHIELYVRWLHEVRRYRPSTVSRRMSVVARFYRTCVIDGALEHSPAEYVRRPTCRRSPRPWA